MGERFEVDGAASTIVVRTRAEGLLARLAHDLQLELRELRGHAEVDGESWSAELRFSPQALRVVGVLRGGELDRGVLSAEDRVEIEARMLRDVFGGGEEEGVVKGQGDSRAGGEAVVTVGGHRGERVRVTMLGVEETRDGGVGRVVARGRGVISLKGLGAKAIKGPLGAFTVRDAVEVEFEVGLIPRVHERS